MLTIEAQIIEGKKIARELGYPTINLNINRELNIKYGVYAAILEYNQREYKGVVNYGITPMHPSKIPKLEMHIFNFSENLYGKYVTVSIKKFIREELKFSSEAELIKQIEIDCFDAQKYFD